MWAVLQAARRLALTGFTYLGRNCLGQWVCCLQITKSKPALFQEHKAFKAAKFISSTWDICEVYVGALKSHMLRTSTMIVVITTGGGDKNK